MKCYKCYKCLRHLCKAQSASTISHPQFSVGTCIWSNSHSAGFTNVRNLGFSIKKMNMARDGKYDWQISIMAQTPNFRTYSLEPAPFFVLLNLHTKTDRKLFYLITFFTISEKGITVPILALYTRPVIGSRNLRISIQRWVRIPRTVSEQANFIITEHHHACCTHYVLWNKVVSD